MIDIVKQNAVSTSEMSAPLAAGTYLVGDPCYAFSNEGPAAQLWMEWLDEAWRDTDANRLRILDGRVRGMRVAASGTAHGDGQYSDQDGFLYGVDAGLLGAVHIGFLANLAPELVGLSREDLEAKTGMRVVDFDRPLHVSWDEDEGVVSIGHIRIDTSDNAWGDEDEDDES